MSGVEPTVPQSDWAESAEQSRATAPRTMEDILSVGCGRRVGDTGNVVVYCQLTQLCSQCDAKLLGISKGQMAGIIQAQQKNVRRLRKILTRRSRSQ
jgi:hypothetical protein